MLYSLYFGYCNLLLPSNIYSMKTALITGASLGIGLEMAKYAASLGHNLVLVARSEQKLQALAIDIQTQYKVAIKVIAADLSDMAQVQHVYDVCVKENIAIDMLINNAGFGDFGMFADSDWGKTNTMIQLNITSLTLMCKLFLPAMQARKNGYIMNVASTAAFQPGPTMAVYYATKSYVLHFSEAIYNELQGSGVHVTCLCPGATESGFQAAAAMEESALIKGKKLPTSKEVAIFGYDAMLAKKMTVIHGTLNYLQANSVRFSSRKMVLKIVRMMQDKK
jgi:uncharacterized protein